tara:strand:- start:413 stop:1123 length:711 start_codon:yes stop_codon:yes gene_type:complete
MNNSKKGNFYFGISEKKIYICFFENDKSYCKENINFEIPDNLDNDLNFEILKNLLKTNIRKIEKRLGFFLNSGNISIQSKSYQSILFSIKNIFDEKQLDKKVITNLVQGGIQKFYFGDQDLSIIHIIINKYIIDDKVYKNFPNNIKFKKIILEIEFICLDKKLINKVKNLFSECKIDVNKIISHEYAKKFANNVSEDAMCLTAHNVISSANQSEVYLETNNRKKQGIFHKIFNLFD